MPAEARSKLCSSVSACLGVFASKASILRGKIEQILLTYGFRKENVTAVMMLYRNTQANVDSPDGHTDFSDIVQQGDTFALHQFIICLDYALRTSIDLIKENGFSP